MAATLEALGIDRMSIEERIELVQKIWDSIAAGASEKPLTETQKAELDRRLEALRLNPDSAIPWDDVEAELVERFGPL